LESERCDAAASDDKNVCSLMRMHTLLLIALVGCKDAAPQAGPPQEMPPADVGVVTVKVEQVTLQTELAGRTTAALVADLRPQVSGIIKARTFEEGALVKAGQVLYQIDSSMYRAVYDQAAADVASAKAALASSKTKNERYVALAKIEGVSKQEADDTRSAVDLATAAVAQKQAALQAARINLGYTSIRAPITGRIGKSTVTAGALVTAGQAEPLATIRSLDPMFVDLTESSEVRLKLRAALGAGTLKAGSTKVKLKLGDGSMYPHDGTLEFAEVAVDEATGMVTLRAQFPNPDDTLLPGMYVRAVLDQAVDQAAMLVPQQGVTHDAKGMPTAMVVGKDGKVEMRTLAADRVIGDRWLVTSGLAAGDQVIVEGLNKIGPGMPVKPSEVTLPAVSGGTTPPAAPGGTAPPAAPGGTAPPAAPGGTAPPGPASDAATPAPDAAK
jgi:membrane fusion protein (multidrug efflux system)